MNGSRYMLVSLIGLLLVVLVGCEAPLFPPNLPRSQYERYSYLRGGQTRAPDSGPFAEESINLYQRLRPLAEQ